MASVLGTIQSNQFSKDIKNLENIKNTRGRAAANFRLKENILGKKKCGQEPVVIVDPETDNEVTTPKAIKNATLKYCVNLLTNREPKPEYKPLRNKNSFGNVNFPYCS